MRIVQELLGLFSAKERRKQALTAKLIRPQLISESNSEADRKPQDNTHLPCDPDGVKSWLVIHSAFNNSASVKNLTRMLAHNNSNDITPFNRLQIMQHFEKPCQHALQSLDTNYLYLDLPLTEEAENAFQTAIGISCEMALGYKTVVAELIQHKTKDATDCRKQAISRALRHLTSIAMKHAQTYREWPKDLWQDANAFARLAMLEPQGKGKKGNKTCRILQSGAEPLDSLQLYSRLCMLHILNTNSYRPEQLQELYVALTKLPAMSFESQATGQGYQDYSVCADSEPVQSQFTRCNKSDNALYFSIASQLTLLESQKDHATDPAIYSLINLADTQRRNVSRVSRNNLINAQSGLKEIHALMRVEPPSKNFNAQSNHPAVLNEDDSSRAQNTNDLLNAVTPAEFGADFIVENQGENGFGLRWSNAGICSLQVGELIAHCYRNNTNQLAWYLAVVRWLKADTDKSLRLGIETITRHADACDVYRLNKGDEQNNTPVEGLLAEYSSTGRKVTLILLPLHKFKPGETVGYRDREGFKLVKLLEPVSLRGNFQCFAVNTVTDSSSPVLDSIDPALSVQGSQRSEAMHQLRTSIAAE